MMAGKMAADNGVGPRLRWATAGDWRQCRAAVAVDNGGGWEGARQRMMVARRLRAAADDDAVIVDSGQQLQQRGWCKAAWFK